ncbi:hypothetical protein GQ602_003052 [Ophiocordyceps camponoti-floridani]|uniref:Uncharacterized protein n=1 Tax=Ophiocordyceps camponoti-floridani TaxID=2030778 RepID=A0A8H4Q7I1_9HYPO|nr:hypothetical protein GQ602_003052 [Ophiocordyceps camponoti-floridani]
MKDPGKPNRPTIIGPVSLASQKDAAQSLLHKQRELASQPGPEDGGPPLERPDTPEIEERLRLKAEG